MLPAKRLKRLIERRNIEPYAGYPLSWNVKLFGPFVSNEMLRAKIGEYFYLNETELIALHPRVDYVIEEVASDAVTFTQVQENMWDSLRDCESYRMYSPRLAKYYGLDYKGAGAEKGLQVDFGLHGRSGGHLVIVQFEGIRLKHYDLDADWETDRWTRQLCCMIEEWDRLFSRESVSSEYLYQLCWLINSRLEDE